jgi:formylglycine-generating enzyme required for sulfatase activity
MSSTNKYAEAFARAGSVELQGLFENTTIGALPPARAEQAIPPKPEVRQLKKSPRKPVSYGLIATQVAAMVGVYFLSHDMFVVGPLSQAAVQAFVSLRTPAQKSPASDDYTDVDPAATDFNRMTVFYKDTPKKPAARQKSMQAMVAQPAVTTQVQAPAQVSADVARTDTPPVMTASIAPGSVTTATQAKVVEANEAVAFMPLPEAVVPKYVPETQANVANGKTFRDCEKCPEMGKILKAPGQPSIGLQEVTFAQWDACVEDGACRTRPSDNGWGVGDRPVINVSYDMITKEYLPWLSTKSKAHYRLPTEPEWDSVARQEVTAELPDPAIPEPRNTSPVTALAATPNGVRGLVGNVWEWVDTCRVNEFAPAQEGEQCSQRIVRGGAWSSEGAHMSAANRGWEAASKTSNALGFRVVRDAALAVGEVGTP